MRARYYHPRLMRFVNADPIGFAGGMNWYAFANGNPMSFVDPSGFCGEKPNKITNQITGFQLPNGNTVLLDLKGGPSKVVRIAQDGQLTLADANSHYRNGNGVPIVGVDATQLNLRGVNPSNFDSNGRQPYTFPRGSGDWLVYGTITLQLNSDRNSFHVLNDTYDFDIRTNEGFSFRNIATAGGNILADPLGTKGMQFTISFEGDVPTTVPPLRE